MTAPAATGRVIRGFLVHEDGTIVGPSGLVLKDYRRPDGYLSVNRRDGGRNVQESVHRLVCEAFHGPPPDDKPWALHRDGNPLNNRAENLYWGTPAENYADSVRHGTAPTGERHGRARLTRSQVDAIRAEYAAGGVSQRELGIRYGVTRSAIRDIVRGRRWKDQTPTPTPHLREERNE